MVVELRSDTYTRPTPGMRQAMATAEVGDDMVGEDPTVNALEDRIARLLGKEAAVFNCSGTQSNQMAVWTHCTAGDELLIEETGHIANYEGGAPAVLSGVSCRKIRGDFGRLDVDHLQGVLRLENIHFSPSRLLCLENTTNLGGGRVYPLAQIERVSEWGRSNGLKVHLDGARFLNACLAGGYSPAELAAPFDSISICFSKGLGCPMGSILVGSAVDMKRARRARKLFGGALRQAGIPAAACLYALDHHVERLKDDHANARLLADEIATIPGLSVDPQTVESNLVFFHLDPATGTAPVLAAALAKRGVKLLPSGNLQRLRACTHLDVDRNGILEAVRILREVMANGLQAETEAADLY